MVKKQRKMKFHEDNLAVMMDFYNPSTYDELREVYEKWFKGIKDELKKRIEKDKKKMGADLPYYMDVREIFNIEDTPRTRQFICNICGGITRITDYDNPNHYTSLEEDKICELCFKLFPKELINRLRNK